jgi:hypothetical protein
MHTYAHDTGVKSEAQLMMLVLRVFRARMVLHSIEDLKQIKMDDQKCSIS